MKHMKPSGVAWIGDIPESWSVVKLTWVARLESGHTPSRSNAEYWAPDECTIPWFSLADIWQVRKEGRVYISETSEKISPAGLANSAARLLPADTVMLSRTASVGFPAIMEIPMATTQDFVNWVCGPRLIPKFLYYIFLGMHAEFRRLMIGSTHQTIYMPDVRAFRAPLPALDVQRAIVDFLDRETTRIDRMIDEVGGATAARAARTGSFLALLTEKRTTLITAAVTGQIDVATWGKHGRTGRRLDRTEDDMAAASMQREAAC